MTLAEELRKGLDELGVKWWKAEPRKTKWHSPVLGSVVAVKELNGELWLVADYESVSPAQAIAATVGNRTDLSKRLREVNGLHAFAELFGFDWTDESDWTWHDVACAMADAVDAATVGVGTCNVEIIDTGNEAAYEHYEHIMHCQHCHHEYGYVQYNEDGDTWMDEPPKHCPNCGKRIEASND